MDTKHAPPAEPTQALSLTRAAARLDVGERTVRRMVDRGDLPTIRVGRLVRVLEADVERFLASRRPTT